VLSFGAIAPSAATQTSDPGLKLGPIVRKQAAEATGLSRVIIRAVDRASLDAVGPAIAMAGGVAGRELRIINARAAVVPKAALAGLSNNPRIAQISLDRPVRGTMEATAATIGALAVRQEHGYDGAGVGVALIDSGIASWHEDLSGENGLRVSEFADFVNGMEAPYDDYGHGTHVAGIVAGNGYDSDGARAGIAPAAQLMVLKVLDASGNGRISDVIAALDRVVERKDALNIRVVNLSVAAGVYESYDTDPLTLAANVRSTPASSWWRRPATPAALPMEFPCTAA
jgi:serine protease AprX